MGQSWETLHPISRGQSGYCSPCILFSSELFIEYPGKVDPWLLVEWFTLNTRVDAWINDVYGHIPLIQERGVLALDGGPGWREHRGSQGEKWQELMRAQTLEAGCAWTPIPALKRGGPPFQLSALTALCCGWWRYSIVWFLKHHLVFDSLPDHPLRQKLEIVNTDSTLDFYRVFRQGE